MLQTVLGDERNLHIGVGRGLARREYASLGIDMDESRSRFDEVLKVLEAGADDTSASRSTASTSRSRRHRCGRIRRTGRRSSTASTARGAASPRSASSPRPASSPFLNPQKPLGDYDKDLTEFRQIREEQMGLPPVPPTIVLFGYCAETQEQAVADATRYSGRVPPERDDALRVRRRPPRQAEDLPALRAAGAARSASPQQPEDLFYVDQIVGTPDECIRRIEHVKDTVRLRRADHAGDLRRHAAGRRREEHPAVRARGRARGPRDARPATRRLTPGTYGAAAQ